MSRPFTTGLHEIGNGCYAYLQPDGSWGWSNAGLVTDGSRTLLIDTLFDLKLTRVMLERMRAVVPAARHIDVLFNTHGNPDHYFGNELASAGEIVATSACAEEMRATTPELLSSLMTHWQMLGEGAAFAREVMGGFDFGGITLTPATRTFRGSLRLNVGSKDVQLIEVGPAHTKGDAIAYLPAERTVFTGDILFIGSHPIMWAGPIGNWISACQRILDLDVDVVVPGHGPITDKSGVRETRDYFLWLKNEVKRRWQEGVPADRAARELALTGYAHWLDRERLAANVRVLYREFEKRDEEPNLLEEFAAMAKLRAALRASA